MLIRLTQRLSHDWIKERLGNLMYFVPLKGNKSGEMLKNGVHTGFTAGTIIVPRMII